MKIVLIDANKMNNKEFHAYFKKKLDFKDYLGNNLDAMYDVLSTVKEELTIYVYNYNKDRLNQYGRSVWNTLKEVKETNKNIDLKEISIKRKET